MFGAYTAPSYRGGLAISRRKMSKLGHGNVSIFHPSREVDARSPAPREMEPAV